MLSIKDWACSSTSLSQPNKGPGFRLPGPTENNRPSISGVQTMVSPEEARYRALAMAGIPPPGQGETASEGRLFGGQRATKALIAFLAATNISCFPGEAARKVDRALKDNLRGLELVEEAERWGEE
jgi:hypothetical protein